MEACVVTYRSRDQTPQRRSWLGPRWNTRKNGPGKVYRLLSPRQLHLSDKVQLDQRSGSHLDPPCAQLHIHEWRGKRVAAHDRSAAEEGSDLSRSGKRDQIMIDLSLFVGDSLSEQSGAVARLLHERFEGVSCFAYCSARTPDSWLRAFISMQLVKFVFLRVFTGTYVRAVCWSWEGSHKSNFDICTNLYEPPCHGKWAQTPACEPNFAQTLTQMFKGRRTSSCPYPHHHFRSFGFTGLLRLCTVGSFEPSAIVTDVGYG